MREHKMKYGILAMMMVLGMYASVAVMESIPTVGIVGMALVFLACSAVLLFCLMKLEVMDFAEGSVWYALNQQVNAPRRTVRTARNPRTVQSARTVSA